MLALVEQVVFFKKLNKVVSNNFFKDLDQMRRQSNWSVVRWGTLASSFVDRDDVSFFKLGGCQTFIETVSPKTV